MAYYGDESRVFLDNETGVSITANDARSIRPRRAIGEELWISWSAADTLMRSA